MPSLVVRPALYGDDAQALASEAERLSQLELKHVSCAEVIRRLVRQHLGHGGHAMSDMDLGHGGHVGHAMSDMSGAKVVVPPVDTLFEQRF